MRKRIGSLLLSLALCLSLLPTAALATEGDSVPQDEHKHPICGAECTDGEHQNQTWKGVSNLSEITEAGYYYLTDNVTLTTAWKPVSGVVLCLNGKTITQSGTDNTLGERSTIHVKNGVTFTLTDCKGGNDTYGQITHATPDANKNYQSGVLVGESSGATFNMYGGNITGNKSFNGGGVHVYSGTFNMYGGEITDNEANNYGGGVFVNMGNTFNMYGGSIANNKSYYGGGVYVNRGSTFNMYDGEITDNEANNYGGVYVREGDSDYAPGKFTMSGGSITNNTTSGTGSNGGGVCMDGEMTVSGAVKITGNYKGGSASNVYLPNGKTISIGTGSLTDGASIGVTTGETLTTGSSVIIATGASDDDVQYFTSDAGTDYEFKLDDGKIVMSKKGTTPPAQTHKHAICVGTDCTDPNHGSHSSVTFTTALTQENGELKKGGESWIFDNRPTISGPNATYVLDGTSSTATYYLDSDLTLSNPLEIKGNVILCLNGHTIRANSDRIGAYDIDTIYVDEGATLTLCDCMGNGTITHDTKSNSTEKYPGKGVAVSGTFNMYGGSISGNSADGYGGGVGVWTNGTFRMYGGTISDNGFTTDNTDHITDHIGGGVYVGGSFELYGGSISSNSASYGGGVYVNNGSFAMSGGTISNNTDTWGGGAGVYLGDQAEARLSGGSISGNRATADGGAGSGVFVDGESTSFTISGNVQIKDNFRDGTASNVYLSSGKTITIGGKLEDEAGKKASIGVTTATTPTTGSSVTIATGANSGDVDHFTADAGADYEFKLDDGKIVMSKKGTTPTPPVSEEHKHPICVGTDCTDPNHSSHSATVNWIGVDDLSKIHAGTSENPNYYYLTSNVTITTVTEAPALDNNVSGRNMYCGWDAPDNVVLCLNGHNITMQNPGDYADKNVAVIRVAGNFTLTDCQTVQGKVTHEAGSNGRGVHVLGGTFNQYGGQITENTTLQYSGGGGVNVGGVQDTARSSVFNLYGGSITHNTASLGGGVYIHRNVRYGPAQFNMYGGSITDNTATVTDETPNSYGVGGGVYVSWTAAFKMSGGTITNNIAKFDGGGVYLSALARWNEYDSGGAAEFEVSGSASITGNTVNGSANNVFLDSHTANNKFETVNSTITIGEGGLASGASIGVTTEKTLTTGSSVTIATGATSGDVDHFSADAGGDYHFTLDGDQVKLVNGTIAATYTVSFNANGGTGTMTDATGVSGSYILPANGFTAPSGKRFKGWATSADGAVISGTTIDVIADTTLYAIWENTPSSSSSSTPAYSVTVDKADNGSVSVSPRSASKGTTVIVTVDPDKGFTLETLTVLDKDGNELKLTDKGNGKYTFTMPASKVTVKATFMDDNTMLNFFVDVKVSDYFYDAVLWAVQSGITTGISDTAFGSNDPCTRAQIVTFLWRAAGSPEPKSASSFTDVPASSYYAKAVAWAVENGITTGTGNGKFSPNAACTREQAVTFLYRAAGSPAVSGGSAFSDVAANAYYADAVAWAEQNGIISGIGGGKFGSGDVCTRAQIVTFLYRAHQGK